MARAPWSLPFRPGETREGAPPDTRERYIAHPWLPESDPMDKIGRSTPTGQPPMRRRVTGEIPMANNIVPLPPPASRAGALSPLNPRARGTATLSGLIGPNAANLPSNLNPAAALTAQKHRRPLELNRK